MGPQTSTPLKSSGVMPSFEVESPVLGTSKEQTYNEDFEMDVEFPCSFGDNR